MTMRYRGPRFAPDKFTLALLATVIFASVLPLPGAWSPGFSALRTGVIAALFFLHGARLSREALVQGMVHYRLHAMVFCSTFVLFPLVALLLRGVLAKLLPSELVAGVIFLCVLPSTVQSSISFASMARGNLAATICSASISTLAGVFLTPILASLFLQQQSEISFSSSSVLRIVVQLLLPFALGQMARKWVNPWMSKYPKTTAVADRSSVLLVVYGAFSEAVNEGLWTKTPPASLGILLVANALILALILSINVWGSRLLGFPKEDEIAIVFAGSKKSLVQGVPMATILFPQSEVGSVLLPVMLFHQIQLMVCASLAERYARRPLPERVE